MRHDNRGYMLVATILMGLVISIVSATFMQYVSNSSSQLNTQTYTAMANEAAEAGIIYASSCIGITDTEWTNLTPNTSCADVGLASPGYVTKSPSTGVQWQSTFTVPGSKNTTANSFGEDSAQYTFDSVGSVSIYQGSVKVKTFSVTKKSSVKKESYFVPISTASTNIPLTDLSTDSHSCATANGKAYCWGLNNKGQVGDNTTANKNSPTQVVSYKNLYTDTTLQSFSAKTVTKIVVGTENSCAIADAQLFCWGDNTYKQLGVGASPATSNIPLVVGGLLTGKRVTDVSVSQGSAGSKSICAIANGVVYCWGANDMQQLGLSTTSINTTTQNTPTRIYGYSSGNSGSPLYQKKATSVSIGDSNGCAIAEGKVYCWGGAASPAKPPVSYATNGYYNGVPNTYAYQDSMRISSKVSCSIVSVYIFDTPICHGQTNGFRTYDNVTIDTFPRYVIPTASITGQDGGGTYASGDEMYCVISFGQPYCQGTSNTGTANLDVPQAAATYDTAFRRLQAHDLNDVNPLTVYGYNRITTNIGTGNAYGNLVANGYLFSWGSDTTGTGVLGYGGFYGYLDHPVHVAASIIGTDPLTLAADGPISVGNNHACAVVDGAALCWGANDRGQLGFVGTSNGKDQPTTVPVIMANGTTKISAGGDHSCSISAQRVYCWGNNTKGELGIGTSDLTPVTKATPLPFFDPSSNLNPSEISSGPNGTCAIANAEAYCWGSNSDLQIGNTSASAIQTTPLKVALPAGKSVTAISVGATHTCAIAGGEGYCWGSNANGELGQGSTADQATPTKVTGGVASSTADTATTGMATSAFTAISAGNSYTCAIINGSAACWGKNDIGQTGNSPLTATQVPTNVSELSSLQTSSISAGDRHACAVAQGKTYCWGNQQDGRLGDFNTANTTRSSPTRLATINGNGGALTSAQTSTKVAAGGSSTCSVANGIIYCWGKNNYDQLGNGDGTHANQSSSVATDEYHYITTTDKGPIF